MKINVGNERSIYTLLTAAKSLLPAPSLLLILCEQALVRSLKTALLP